VKAEKPPAPAPEGEVESMTVLSRAETPGRAPERNRLRVALILDLKEGAQERFLEVYEAMRHQVAGVPGHISDQLCQSIENPAQWLITSEWESASPFLSWVNSEEHVRMVRPMHECVYDTRSLRFAVVRETVSPGHEQRLGAAGRDEGRMVAPCPDGVVRHALTFTVKPGSERAVAEILAGYASPRARVDARTRLLRTSLFMRGNRVVRAIEVAGDLGAALRHVAAQSQVRAAEEALNPYLEQARDLGDPQSARAFFTRAALPAVHRVAAPGAAPADRKADSKGKGKGKGKGEGEGELPRRALIYPALPGCGAPLARMLARQDQLVVGRQPSPLAGSTVFQRDDTVVRVVEFASAREQDPAVVLGVSGRRAAAVLTRLVDPGEAGDLTGEAGIKRFLVECEMDLVTDRRSPST
jgi:heme-degrading monooxygenase HmoA